MMAPACGPPCLQVLHAYLALIFSATTLGSPGQAGLPLPGLGRPLPASSSKDEYERLVSTAPRQRSAAACCQHHLWASHAIAC